MTIREALAPGTTLNVPLKPRCSRTCAAIKRGSASAENAAVGRADVCIDVDVKGAGCSVAFNPDFVLDALRVTDSEVVRIDLTDESTPAKFTLGESFTYVHMPISG